MLHGENIEGWRKMLRNVISAQNRGKHISEEENTREAYFFMAPMSATKY